MNLSDHEIIELLESKYDLYNRKSFIATDPIFVPHLFNRKEDIEIASFLSATIAWGQRKTIVKNAQRLVELMDMEPYDFVMQHSNTELQRLAGFKHRTFNGEDAMFFVQSLKNIYENHGGLEKAFSAYPSDMQRNISAFKTLFFKPDATHRSRKHVSDPAKNSAAKRLNMFLRWMVRKDNRGVDFGIWESILPNQLYCPLDVHSGNVARKLGLLARKQDDWKATLELTENLRKFDSADPTKYDFSLFGLGVFEKF